MAILREKFGEHIVSRFGPVNWTPRSGDITFHDFFLWVFVKSKVYIENLATIESLETNITRVISKIPIEMHEHVIDDVRMDHVSHSYGQNLK